MCYEKQLKIMLLDDYKVNVLIILLYTFLLTFAKIELLENA